MIVAPVPAGVAVLLGVAVAFGVAVFLGVAVALLVTVDLGVLVVLAPAEAVLVAELLSSPPQAANAKLRPITVAIGASILRIFTA